MIGGGECWRWVVSTEGFVGAPIGRLPLPHLSPRDRGSPSETWREREISTGRSRLLSDTALIRPDLAGAANLYG